MLHRSLALAVLVLFGYVAPAFCQGFIIAPDHPGRLPRPIVMPTPVPVTAEYQVKSLTIQARVTDQAARVQVSQTFKNHSNTQIQAQFLFPLPQDGAIDSLTLMVDGEEWQGRILPADEAKTIYEDIVRRMRDPALLEWIGRGMFQTSVFPIPAQGERTVTITYTQLLRKDQGLTEFQFPLSTARYTCQPLEKLQIDVSLESTIPIRNVYSPTHAVSVQKPDETHAHITMSAENQTPGSDFRLFFDVDPGQVAARVLSYRPRGDEAGYFLMLATPQIPQEQEQLPKTIIFVVDKSGSMSGPKMEQAQEALRFVLNNLHEGDLFNIVAYDREVISFRPELETYNNENRQAALGFVDSLYAGGSTNIHDALVTALNQLQDPNRPSYVLFMTDGLPTAGVQNESEIAVAVKSANSHRARILNFGVGFDVNSRLLGRLADENSGASEYVRPDEDIEAYVSRVYRKIAAPVLTDVQVAFDFDMPVSSAPQTISRLYPSGTFDLFAGQQAVIVGRYDSPGIAKVTITGSVRGETKTFDFPAEFAAESPTQNLSFVESLWAVRRIGDILNEIDLHGKNDELIAELVLLSTRHGILTPYTSFLADETSRPTELAESESFRRNSLSADRELGQLEIVDGISGVAQRSAQQGFSGAYNAPGAAAPADGYASGYGYGGYRDAETDEYIVTETVRQVGSTALYRRGEITLTPQTADLDLEADAAKIIEIERFSDEYFDLVTANSAEENLLLSQQQPEEMLLVQFRGQNYLIR